MLSLTATSGCSTASRSASAAETAPHLLPGSGTAVANDASVTVRTIEIAQMCEAFPPTEPEARRWIAARLSNGGLSPTNERIDVGLDLMRRACENPGAAARSGL